MGLLEVHREAAAGLVGSLDAFAQNVTLEDPDGVTREFAAQVADIGQTIDPETQMAVAGRQVSLVLSESQLTNSGLGIPKAVQGPRPWMADYLERRWRVTDVRRDRTLGLVTLFLEASK